MRPSTILSLLLAVVAQAPSVAAQAVRRNSRTAPLSVSDIARLASPAAVTVIAIGSSRDTLAVGSGFIVRSDGAVVTCWHVLQGASNAVVVLASGERYDRVAVQAADSALDLAVLKIPGYELPALRVRSSAPAVGETVVAIGSPLGLSQTVSAGIVSASRVVEGRQLVQVTAPISPGSSGGPILDNQGRAFAVADMFIRGGQQLNFAVPARYAMGLLGDATGTLSVAQVFGGSAPLSESPDSLSAGGVAASAVTPQRTESPLARLTGAFFVQQQWHGGRAEGARDVGFLIPTAAGGWLVLAPQTGDTTVGKSSVYLVRALRTNAAGDVALDAGGVAFDGYQTVDGGFFVTSTLGDSAGTSLTLSATPSRLPLTWPSGLYDASVRTADEVGGSSALDYTDWRGEVAVAIANDSIYVLLQLYNDAGGSTGMLASGRLAPDGSFDVAETVKDGTRRLHGSIEAGVMTADWVDDRGNGRFTGTLSASRK